MATSGTLKITVVGARFDRDVEIFGTQDPYVVIRNRYESKRTKTHTDGGKEPEWNEEIELDVKYIGDDMELEVKDDNVILADEVLGVATIKMSSLCIPGGIDDWWEVAVNGKKTGAIHLIGNWFPKTSGALAEKDKELDALRQQQAELEMANNMQQQQAAFAAQTMAYRQQQAMLAQQQAYAQQAAY